MKHTISQLNNGLTLINIYLPESQTTTVLSLVRTGSKYEPAHLNGISHFLEHMCFKGTTTRSNKDIAHAIEGSGAVTNAYTDYEMTGYYIKGAAKGWQKYIDIIADIYLHSTFPEIEIEKERGVIMGEIDMYEDDPKSAIWFDWMKLLYGTQPVGQSILGTKAHIRRFQRDDFLQYHRDHYHASKTVVVIAGPHPAQQTQRVVGKFFRDIPSGRSRIKEKVRERQISPALFVRNRKTDQAHIILGVRTFPTTHIDMPVLRMLDAIMGQGMSSRLFMRLREDMGAGYYVTSLAHPFTDHGYWAVATGTSPDRVEEVVHAIMEELRHLSSELVPEGEFKKAQEYLLGRFAMSLESSDEWAEYMGHQYIVRGEIKLPRVVQAEIKRVTPRDIQRVAKKIFQNTRLNAVIMSPDDHGTVVRKMLHF